MCVSSFQKPSMTVNGFLPAQWHSTHFPFPLLLFLTNPYIPFQPAQYFDHIFNSRRLYTSQNDCIIFASEARCKRRLLNSSEKLSKTHRFPRIIILVGVKTRKWNLGLQRGKVYHELRAVGRGPSALCNERKGG